MRNVRNIPARDYEELMEEQRGRIPVYCREWTNYNPSDPGITILENLTGVHLLQQAQMDEPTDAVKEKLLGLLGYMRREERCAQILLEAEAGGEGLLIPAGQPFALQDIVYETQAPRRLPAGRITGIFGEDEEGLHDYSFLLQREFSVGAYVFGRNPKAGACLYFVTDKPLLPGEEALLHISVAGAERRNPFAGEQEPVFGRADWECYTGRGFVPVRMQDGTRGFLQDGTLEWRQACLPARFEKGTVSGYVWRAVLKEAGYDIPPSLLHVTGFLFPAVQKKTLAAVYTFDGALCVTPDHTIGGEDSICVFCREAGEGGYRRYRECAGEPERGRFFFRKRNRGGRDSFCFDRRLFGYGPDPGKDAVKVVVYSGEITGRYDLGKVCGYDGQEIGLPGEHVTAESFSVIAERGDGSGEAIYHFIEPDADGEGALSYKLRREEGRIAVLDAGDYIGARLYAGSLAVTMGEAGNVRAGNVFTARGMERGVFFNPVPGRGGRFRETVEELRRRFAADLDRPWAAALPADYEALAGAAPGLCIGKVRAWMEEGSGEVQVAVMPALPEKFPRLNAVYRRTLEQWLERHRMLSVRIRVRDPVYVPVSVSGTVYVKPHYEKCGEEIEAAVARELDYRKGPQRFGQPLSLHRLLCSLEALECVVSVGDLAVSLRGSDGAVQDGGEIRPTANGLLCPGSLDLEVVRACGDRA